MSDPLSPALSPEEWQQVRGTDFEGWQEKYYSAHGRAAINLHNQPFGFTHADVEALDHEGNELTAGASDAASEDEASSMVRRGFALLRLRDRIKALLPPKETP
jgi:hypothetical protein